MSDDKKLPEEWATELGHVLPGPTRRGPESPESYFDTDHAVASALHGWALDAHHYQGDRLRLSRSDYEAALKAAQTCDAQGTPSRHLPALSRACPKYAALTAGAKGASKSATSKPAE